ncbi:hypothetical protein NNC19_18260 [Clostridium sp. SHJSY1]|uniref:hypothetical protein n=1 Tax=Clostridium sp. SHJSY1 TaxID=2942483 RepID=UPI0028759955|nr:hypothetical protein [Clostridium sp. SHJSY1]MDS0527636.1 hypothetical protein [Clostridium sp. SHJSY1]
MKNLKHYLFVSIILIILSLGMFFIHYEVFGQLENTIYYSVMNICFIPINILAVTVLFDKLAERRRYSERLSKLNMLVGLFFSDIGYKLLKVIVAGDEKIKKEKLDFNDLKLCNNWLREYDHDIDFEKIDYNQLKNLVVENRDILASLISNENILEHETFADLLIALVHLRDEIVLVRYKELTKEDCGHLKGDVVRVYKALTFQWTSYLQHLKEFYPYQYSSYMKLNPLKS